MKEFTKIESGIYITKGINTINELNNMHTILEEDTTKVGELAEIVDEFEIPQIDILNRVQIIEIIDQYTFANDIKEMTPYSTVEDIERSSYREVEVKRIENTLVYTLMQDEFKAVGKADLNMFSYMDAVELAKSRAIVELEYLKQEKIVCNTTLDRARVFVVIEGGVK